MQRYLALKKVVELGSFTRAAEVLGYTQSAMSQMISSLEHELDLQLLIRSRTGIRLTPEGAAVYPRIQQLTRQYQAVQEAVQELNGLETGVVRMGTLASISAHWLPDLLKTFQARYPGVDFLIRQGDYSSIQAWVKDGTVDFGFLNPAAAAGLDLLPLKQGAMIAVLPEDHPLAQLETVPLAALAREPFLLLEEGHYSEPLEAFRRSGLSPRIRYTIHDDYAIMTMVEAGLGVSILSELILHRTSYRLALRPTDPPITRDIAIACRDRSALPMASRRFIAHLQQHVPSLP